MRPNRLRTIAAAIALVGVAACSAGGSSANVRISAPDSTTVAPTTPATPPTTISATTNPATTGPATTVSTRTTTTTAASTTTTTSATTTTSTTTVPVGSVPVTTVIGTSVNGVPIVAERYGTEGGRKVLIVGVIHGNETDGAMIVDELRTRGEAGGVPDTVELWLIESMNPDGQAIYDRQNANEVDLNRNFPKGWEPLGEPGDGQYAGTGPASEPETQAMVAFITDLQPDIAIWYHQDLYTISPSTGRSGRIRQRYSDITGIPMGEITGGRYTGIAATWARSEISSHDGVAFIVELGATTSPQEVSANADAVLTIAAEG